MVKLVALVNYILVVNFIFLFGFILGKMIMDINDMRTLTLQEYDRKYNEKTLFDDNIPIIIGVFIHILLSIYIFIVGDGLKYQLPFLDKLVSQKHIEKIEKDVIYWFSIDGNEFNTFNKLLSELSLNSVKRTYVLHDAIVDRTGIIIQFGYDKITDSAKLNRFVSMFKINKKTINIYTDATETFKGVKDNTLEMLSEVAKINIEYSGTDGHIQFKTFNNIQKITNPKYIELNKFITSQLDEVNETQDNNKKLDILMATKSRVVKEINNYSKFEIEKLQKRIDRIDMAYRKIKADIQRRNIKIIPLNTTHSPHVFFKHTGPNPNSTVTNNNMQPNQKKFNKNKKFKKKRINFN